MGNARCASFLSVETALKERKSILYKFFNLIHFLENVCVCCCMVGCNITILQTFKLKWSEINRWIKTINEMKSENPPWWCSNFPVPSSPTLQKNRKRKRKLHLYHIIMLCKTCNLISQAQYCYCKPCKSAPADQKVKLWAKWLGKELL